MMMSEFIRILFDLSLIVCSLAAWLLIARIIAAPFSRKVRAQIVKHPMMHALWVLCAVIGVIGSMNPFFWPPPSVERSAQWRTIMDRIDSAGGWAALKRDCDSLAATNWDNPDGFRWYESDTNSLPPAIAALHPKMVDFYSPEELRQLGNEGAARLGGHSVVRILVFGSHSTGGHDIPALGLEVMCEPGITNYNPIVRNSITPPRFWKYQRITNDIYEFY